MATLRGDISFRYLKQFFLVITCFLSGKTKKLWSGQAALRRSRRSRRKKIKTKTMFP
jgi:hypothetical protein